MDNPKRRKSKDLLVQAKKADENLLFGAENPMIFWLRFWKVPKVEKSMAAKIRT